MAGLRAAFLAAAIVWAAPAEADPVDRWAAYIAEASTRFGVPEPWIRRVMRAESGGRTLLGGRPVVSRAGAMGLMQLMPDTWRELRSLLGLGNDPHDPRDNILAGTAYLRAMYDRFGYPGLFAAYNAGPGRYSQHLSAGRRLPAETVAYVANVAGDESPPVRTEAGPKPILFAVVRRADGPPSESAGSEAASEGGLFVHLGNSAPR
jgi:soluble lytic murein transglycosylase-like protein